MNRNIFILSLFLFITFLFACQKDEYRYFLETWLSENFSGSSIVLIIPNAGCQGCISSAENLTKEICESSESLGVKIIFTEISSLKILKSKINSVCEATNIIFLDKGNSLRYHQSNNVIYPSIIYLSNGKISKIDVISPSSPNSIDNLKKRINALESTKGAGE